MKPVTAKSVLSQTNTALRTLGRKVEASIQAKTGHACQFVTVAISVESDGLNLGTGVIVEAHVLAGYPHAHAGEHTPRDYGTPSYALTADVVKAIKAATGAARCKTIEVRNTTNSRGEIVVVECGVNYKGNDVPQIIIV